MLPMDRGYALVCARVPLAERLIASLPIPGTRVDPETLLAAVSKRRPSIVFVELDLLKRLDRGVFTLPVVALVDGTLPTAIDALARYQWLSHLVAEPLLATPQAPAHLAQLVARVAHGPEHVMVADEAVGRTALLASSQRREARFDRMREFFAQSGISSRTIGVAIDAAEELVTNAIYDAPVEARYFAQPIPRTEPVSYRPSTRARSATGSIASTCSCACAIRSVRCRESACSASSSAAARATSPSTRVVAAPGSACGACSRSRRRSRSP